MPSSGSSATFAVTGKAAVENKVGIAKMAAKTFHDGAPKNSIINHEQNCKSAVIVMDSGHGRNRRSLQYSRKRSHFMGYSKYDYRNKATDNSRNGHSSKRLHTSFGDVEVSVP
mgnify:FL=1